MFPYSLYGFSGLLRLGQGYIKSQPQFKLIFDQFIILPPHSRQSRMSSLFHNMSSVQYHYIVSVFDSTKSMRYNNYRLPIKQFVQIFHYHAFIICIQRVSCLVKKEIPSILVCGTCYEHPLFLTRAQALAFSSNLGVVSKGKIVYPSGNVRDIGSGMNF